MKKRMLCLFLAAILLTAALTQSLPRAEAANSGYQVLADFIQQNGSPAFSNSYGYATEKSLREADAAEAEQHHFQVVYHPQKHQIEVYYSYLSGYAAWLNFSMTLNQDGSISNIYASNGGGEAHYRIVPAAFTLTSMLTVHDSLGDTEGFDPLATYLMKEALEELRLILAQGGSNLAALGFTSYPAGHTHSWGGAVILEAPSCKFGSKELRCGACGSVRRYSLSPTKAHSWDQGTVTQEPTCTETGWMRYSCVVCMWQESKELPALGHAWQLSKVVTEPQEGQELHSGFAEYTCSRCQASKEGRLCAAEVFTDMPADGNWAHAAIDWAYFGGVTSGKTATTFAPKATVTRAEVVSFLYKAMGSPAPAGTENPFTDVAEGKYYYKPVLWAVGAGSPPAPRPPASRLRRTAPGPRSSPSSGTPRGNRSPQPKRAPSRTSPRASITIRPCSGPTRIKSPAALPPPPSAPTRSAPGPRP
ncbi:MAG: S-layer homology domain-containing protein [Oscillospiraceae bacterium]|nr:S-layer homology domain-containing protein [Oscillospiraceae bacterium]